MNENFDDNISAALLEANRTGGWNFRNIPVQRFELPARHGCARCILIVVPARRWAYRRWERQAAAKQRHDGAA